MIIPRQQKAGSGLPAFCECNFPDVANLRSIYGPGQKWSTLPLVSTAALKLYALPALPAEFSIPEVADRPLS